MIMLNNRVTTWFSRGDNGSTGRSVSNLFTSTFDNDYNMCALLELLR